MPDVPDPPPPVFVDPPPLTGPASTENWAELVLNAEAAVATKKRRCVSEVDKTGGMLYITECDYLHTA